MKNFIIEKEKATSYIRGVRNAEERAQPEVYVRGISPDVSWLNNHFSVRLFLI